MRGKTPRNEENYNHVSSSMASIVRVREMCPNISLEIKTELNAKTN